MPPSFRLLTQAEIEVLRWLVEHAAQSRPIILPARLRMAVPPLWRMGLVEVWFRCFPHDEPQAAGAYFALTVAGSRRAQAFLSSRRAATAARSSPPPRSGRS
jgi:hypothetical protein